MEWEDAPVMLRAWVDRMDLDLRNPKLPVKTIAPVERKVLFLRSYKYGPAFAKMAHTAGAVAIYDSRAPQSVTVIGDRLGLDLLQRAWVVVLSGPGKIEEALSELAQTQMRAGLDAYRGVTSERVRPREIVKLLLETYSQLRGDFEIVKMEEGAIKVLTPCPIVAIHNQAEERPDAKDPRENR